ncbi:DUF6455 family protein [Salipiger marinus]|mgnify:FL=1|uniref:DUF6455 family protein n=1 Tax=Salipiger marinus TaxID=555512 RepID=UPI000E9FBB53|nr:DUF6455 family protein [Salipiger manganoxidans]MCD1617270.1 DUF6455 family protein [Salipiger manganoxidans]MEB3417317.1 DUF6455 family protein [Salipiger manganoxidans]HBT01463.1 hypothetical protein [Citreicella sp.]
MPGREDLKRHARLVDDMATALGLDLQEQMLRGRLDMDGLEEAVFSCTACTRPGDCESWLAQHNGTPEQAPPDYCRNATLFSDLRKG